jgi:hypothetical protein
MKRLLFISALFLFHAGLMAQKDSSKVTIAVPQFFLGGDQKDLGRTSSIQETVIGGFVKAKRFKVIERTQMAALDNEWKLTASGGGGGYERMIQEGKRLGVEFLILGTINYLNIQDPSQQNSNPVRIKGVNVPTSGLSYEARVGLSLKVVNVETAEIVEADKLSGTGKDSKSGFNAMDKAIESVEKETDKFIDRYFPVMISIADILESSNGKAKTVLIAAGARKGYKVGDKFSIVKISTFDDPDNPGKKIERKEIVGEANLSKLEETTSVCKIVKGNDLVFTNWKNLKFITKENVKGSGSF